MDDHPEDEYQRMSEEMQERAVSHKERTVSERIAALEDENAALLETNRALLTTLEMACGRARHAYDNLTATQTRCTQLLNDWRSAMSFWLGYGETDVFVSVDRSIAMDTWGAVDCSRHASGEVIYREATRREFETQTEAMDFGRERLRARLAAKGSAL
jgi:hypothetical protein